MRLLITILAAFLFLVSCKPNQDAPCRKVYTDTIALQTSLSALFPYVLNDSSVYVSSNNDTLLVYTDSTANVLEMSNLSVNPECPPDSVAYKGKFMRIANKQDSRTFTAGIFLLGKNQVVEIWTGASYFINPASFFTQKQTGYYDSVTVGGISYTNVYRLASLTDTIYLNSSKGFIKMISGNKSWTLLQR